MTNCTCTPAVIRSQDTPTSTALLPMFDDNDELCYTSVDGVRKKCI